MWTNELEMQFLECYQTERVLWDPTNRHRKDRNIVHDAWNRISEVMGIPIKDLKKKKDSLMATYRSHLRKLRSSLQSGADADDIYKPIWFAFQFMNSFLGKNIKMENPTINTIDSDRGNENADVEIQLSQAEEEETLQEIPPNEMAFNATVRRKKNSPELQEAERNMTDAADTLKSILTKNQTEDDCDLYAKLLAKKLRRLPEDERIRFMYEIDGIYIHRLKNLKKKRSWT